MSHIIYNIQYVISYIICDPPYVVISYIICDPPYVVIRCIICDPPCIVISYIICDPPCVVISYIIVIHNINIECHDTDLQFRWIPIFPIIWCTVSSEDQDCARLKKALKGSFADIGLRSQLKNDAIPEILSTGLNTW